MQAVWKPVLATRPSCRGRELSLSCSRLCHFPCGCCRGSWLRTGSLCKGPRQAQPGVDKRGKADDVIWLFPRLLSGSPGPWGWHLPSHPHPCKLPIFVPGPLVRIGAPPAVLAVLCVRSPRLCLTLTFTTYTLTGYSFLKPRPLAICHCALRISLRPVQRVLVPHSETSKQDPRRS